MRNRAYARREAVVARSRKGVAGGWYLVWVKAERKNGRLVKFGSRRMIPWRGLGVKKS